MTHPMLHPTQLAAALLAAFPQAQAQTADGEAPHTVVVIGSRAAARSALDTAMPVGLVGSKDLASTGTAVSSAERAPAREPITTTVGGDSRSTVCACAGGKAASRATASRVGCKVERVIASPFEDGH